MADSTGASNVLLDSTGNTPVVSADLNVENRNISDVNQAVSVCETMVNDAKKLILNAARITSKLNGERPYNQSKLKNAAKDWKTNISTGFLSTECGKIVPRFYMPIKTAKYLTAAQLPANHPNGAEKTTHFRQIITDTVRGWRKFNPFVRGIAKEVAVFGYGFASWFDEFDWRPTLLRMDRGFVPQGTEVMEEPTFFMAKWDYKPHELLDLVRRNSEAGRTEWLKDNVVRAINNAQPPPTDSSYPEARKYEDLIREATWGYSYTKGAKVIRTWHLFSKETTGRVSHYVVLADSAGAVASTQTGSDSPEDKLLFEHLDQYGSMGEATQPLVFEYGDGTIHGAWGVGQILYDLAVQVEKVRCDSIDNIRLTNKIKAQVPDAKNVNDVSLVVNDQMVIISGAQFSGNTSGMGSDVEGYEALDMKLTQIAQQKIGAFVPPIPVQPSDVKAAQINAAMAQERELQEALLENWLIQWAEVMRVITMRLCDVNSPDEVAQQTYIKLLEKLTPEEIVILADQAPVRSVMDFTEFKAQQRAAFATSVVNNPLFKQSAVARVMAEGAGDEAFVDELVIKEGDQTDVLSAQRQQSLECAAMANGDEVPVLPSDNDWVHMQTLQPKIEKKIMEEDVGSLEYLQREIQHYAAHWGSGVNKKTIPKDQINETKQFVAIAEKALAALTEKLAVAQQTQQAVAQADAQALKMVQSGEV